MELGKWNALTVALVGGVVAAVSIIAATIWGELPEAAWLVFSVGFFGGGLTCLGALGVFLLQRVRARSA